MSKVWIIQAVREWGSRKSYSIYYMAGFQKAVEFKLKPGFTALTKIGDVDKTVYYRPFNIVCDRLPEDCVESTFQEIYNPYVTQNNSH